MSRCDRTRSVRAMMRSMKSNDTVPSVRWPRRPNPSRSNSIDSGLSALRPPQVIASLIVTNTWLSWPLSPIASTESRTARLDHPGSASTSLAPWDFSRGGTPSEGKTSARRTRADSMGDAIPGNRKESQIVCTAARLPEKGSVVARPRWRVALGSFRRSECISTHICASAAPRGGGGRCGVVGEPRGASSRQAILSWHGGSMVSTAACSIFAACTDDAPGACDDV
eukprot:scaffold64677_cov30-Tisochrysis_lutea.AAC.6